MIFEDQLTIQAPAQEVWDFLLDVDRSSACVPGVDQVTLVDERTFDGIISASVGPISGKFTFRANILESDPPRELKAEVQGSDSVTKSKITVSMGMKLNATGPRTTVLAHRAQVEINGRLAILGDMVIRATATLILEEFTKRLRADLEAK